MRNAGWKIIVFIMMILLLRSTAFTEGFSGWVSLVKNNSESFEDDEKVSETEMFNRNLYLKLNKSITPLFSYQLDLRTNLSDTGVTNSAGSTTATDRRKFEPALGLSLNNNMYDISLGLRLQEEWTSSQLKDENRETSGFFYNRFSIFPKALPSLSINIDRQKTYDYPPQRNKDLIKDTYSINSAYVLPSTDLKLRYDINYTHNVDKTPLSATEKMISDNFNTNYDLGYSGYFWGRKATYNLGYQGNYAEDRTEQFLASSNTQSTVTSFNQGLNINANVRPQAKLGFTFNYSLDRADQNPVSLGSSMSGVISNIFTDSISGDEDDFSSNITRNYGVTTTWLTHAFLTTTLRFQRNENFDNLKEIDTDSNTYHISFNYIPLPTLDASLSLIRSDRYSFSEKNSTNNSALLSIGSRLYRDVNMITDFGYTKSRSFISDTEVSAYSINGNLDALITRELSGTMSYGYDRTSSDSINSISKEAMATLNYQPGRFINFSGNYSISDSDGDKTISEGLLMDWLLLPAIRLNLSYNHTDSEPGPVISDTLSGYGIWYITKFADVRLSYAYTKQEETVITESHKTESHNLNTNLNCRF
jgi:hypothetical protein